VCGLKEVRRKEEEDGKKGKSHFLQKGARKALFPSSHFLLPHSTPTELYLNNLKGEYTTGKKMDKFLSNVHNKG
jgi:hypothetical protein